MFKRFFAVFLVVLAIAGIAVAEGPAPRTIASGTSDLLIALCDTAWTNNWTDKMTVQGSYPTMVEIKFPDADVTYSFWTFTNPSNVGADTVGTWSRLTGRHDNSDTVGTLYSGDILRADERARFVFINRTNATGGIVNRWY